MQFKDIKIKNNRYVKTLKKGKLRYCKNFEISNGKYSRASI